MSLLQRPVYDAEAAGAKCSVCPFRGRRPVGPENPGADTVILGESPGEREDEVGKPFVGASGWLLNNALRQFGVARESLHITNTVLCKPKEGATEADWSTALECCRPRLEGELNNVLDSHDSSDPSAGVRNRRGLKVILAAGAKAHQFFTGRANIFPWIGGPYDWRGHTVVPSIHPAFALRSPAYIPVFKTFLARALGLSSGQLDPVYSWPRLVTQGPYREPLSELLHRRTDISVDIENLPSSGRIRCIGVGDSTLAISVPLPPEGSATPEELDLLRAVLKSDRKKIYQNGQFDRSRLNQSDYPVAGPYDDTLLMHAVVAPRLPHDLGFMFALETPAERYKTIFGAAKDDKEKQFTVFERAGLDKLLPYNAKDVAAQAILRDALSARLDTVHRGRELYDNLIVLDGIAQKMSETGICVATDKFQTHRTNLTTSLDAIRQKFHNLGIEERFTLGAVGTHPSLRELFFDKFRAPVVSRSKETKEASLDGKALTYYVGYFTSRFAPEVAEAARLVLQYRKHAKLLTSYINAIDSDVVHPIWRVFGTRTGRWSSTLPAMQTIPKGMRDIFCAREGRLLFDADYSQLELRIVALLAGAKKLLQWYAEGRNVHTMNAMAIFKTSSPTDKQRDLAKRVVFNSNYGGSAETAWKALIVDFPGLRLSDVEYVYNSWFQEQPEIREWQQKMVREAEINRYVEEPVSGRRQYYHDGNISPTEVINFPVQTAAGEIANRAVRKLAENLTWSDDALLMQVHDSLVVEAINSDRMIPLLKSSMEQEIELNGSVVRFPVDVKVGTNWGALKKVA